jgi:hypothetical protein
VGDRRAGRVAIPVDGDPTGRALSAPRAALWTEIGWDLDCDHDPDRVRAGAARRSALLGSSLEVLALAQAMGLLPEGGGAGTWTCRRSVAWPGPSAAGVGRAAAARLATTARDPDALRSAPDAFVEALRGSEVATRLHFLATVVADLVGMYNAFGVRRWFERPRSALGGRSPPRCSPATGIPTTEGPLAVRSLARSLVGSSAT